MLRHQTRAERILQGGETGYHAQKPGENHDVLDRRLPRVAAYKALMPFAIASHSSCSFGRKTEMANMAITTNTPTKMAYSVVPCPREQASFDLKSQQHSTSFCDKQALAWRKRVLPSAAATLVRRLPKHIRNTFPSSFPTSKARHKFEHDRP